MTNRIGSAISDRDEGIEAELARDDEHGKGGEHDQVAMGEIDQPHDAEDQRQPGREQRVEAAEQNALDQCIEPAGHVMTPK